MKGENMNEKTYIYAYKHDGSFHRFWSNQKNIKKTKDYCIVSSTKGSKVHESSGYYWFSQEPAVTYFSYRHWFNIIVMFKKTEVIYYCNLATPAVFESNSLKYIDYDIDVKYYTNTKKIKVLDKNEYKINKRKYKYDQWIEDKIEEELQTLIYWIKNEIGPFSHKFRMEMKEELQKEDNVK